MSDSQVIEKEDVDVDDQQDQDEDQEHDPEEPDKYKVIVHNDEFTTFMFVTRMFRSIFRKSPSVAERLTREVHEKGQAVGGIYSKQIAETKVHEATDMAREEGHPLQITMEPAEE